MWLIFNPGMSSGLAQMQDKPWQSAVSATISEASKCMAIPIGLLEDKRPVLRSCEVQAPEECADLICHPLADVEELLAGEAANLW